MVIENVKMFEDKNFNKEYNSFSKEGWSIEIHPNNKVKVRSTDPFSKKKKSRLNKVKFSGSWIGGQEPNRYAYQVTVNGKEAFFIVEYNIFENK